MNCRTRLKCARHVIRDQVEILKVFTVVEILYEGACQWPLILIYCSYVKLTDREPYSVSCCSGDFINSYGLFQVYHKVKMSDEELIKHIEEMLQELGPGMIPYPLERNK